MRERESRYCYCCCQYFLRYDPDLPYSASVGSIQGLSAAISEDLKRMENRIMSAVTEQLREYVASRHSPSQGPASVPLPLQLTHDFHLRSAGCQRK